MDSINRVVNALTEEGTDMEADDTSELVPPDAVPLYGNPATAGTGYAEVPGADPDSGIGGAERLGRADHQASDPNDTEDSVRGSVEADMDAHGDA